MNAHKERNVACSCYSVTSSKILQILNKQSTLCYCGTVGILDFSERTFTNSTINENVTVRSIAQRKIKVLEQKKIKMLMSRKLIVQCYYKII